MKRFLNESNNIDRDSYIWNMLSGMLVAFQSVILLIILTRTVDLAFAGIFTIANANANLFLTVGKYGVRNYQVSDVKYEYSFFTYRRLRWITSVIMIIVSTIYLLYSSISNSYTLEKSLIIFWMCMYKFPESFEDVYYGEYQRTERLDIAGKAMTVRIVLTMILFSAVVILTHNLLFAVISATVFSFLLMFYLLFLTRNTINNATRSLDTDHPALKNLVISCFPVFAASFLSFYIGNAPKYAIDSQLSDELQAIYGFLSMPVFVIGLLNSFIFNPILFKLSCEWADGRIQDFKGNILRQTVNIVIITLVCVIGAYIIGVPVLSWLYNTDLTNYRSELLLLLVGGGFLGASGVYMCILTIMRLQTPMMIGYGIISLFALIFSTPIVFRYKMMGAVVLYDLLMLGLCLIFIIIIWFGIQRGKKG